MRRNLLVIFSGILIGIITGYFISSSPLFYQSQYRNNPPLYKILLPQNQVIGFLPYWLLDKAKTDYSPYITTLTYFGLNIDNDGTILKLANPQEEEPGWNALSSGRVNPFFDVAKKNGISLSLLLFDGDQDSIDQLMADPVAHADNLVHDVSPLMKQYGFSDLNLDIESVIPASDGAQLHFSQFAAEVKKDLNHSKLGTLTIEISPTDLIRRDLIYPRVIADIADTVVIMAYDYHYIGSYVTGPVAPLSGAGTVSEYDAETAVQKALVLMPPQKIILGIPLYGYGWETIGNTPRSAVIPDTGLTESSDTVAQFMQSCASCSAQIDPEAQESYLIYKDQDTGTFHQIFYPEKSSTNAKIQFAKQEDLGGLALWALGYEDGSVLDPLREYK